MLLEYQDLRRRRSERTFFRGMLAGIQLVVIYAVGVSVIQQKPTLAPPPQVLSSIADFVNRVTPLGQKQQQPTVTAPANEASIMRIDPVTGKLVQVSMRPAANLVPLESIDSTHTTPPYPLAAIRRGVQGTVTLRIEVGTDGVVSKAAIAESSGSSLLDNAALAWVKQHWRYRSAVQDGHGVTSTTLASVIFDLMGDR